MTPSTASVVAALTFLVGAGVSPLLAQARCDVPWALRETLRIGSIDGPDALTGVLDVDVGPDGRVYVTQPFVPAVSVFTPDGRFARTIGRAGDGPGEFRMSASRLGWIRDTLWVTDFGAMHFFKPDGTEARQVRFSTPLLNEGSVFRPGVPFADGTFLGQRDLSGDIPRFFLADRLSIPRFSPRGEILNTIGWIKQRVLVNAGGFTVHPLDDWGSSLLPYTVTADGSGVILLGDVRDQRRPASFDLLKLGLTGDTLLKRSIAYEPRPLTRADARWLTDAYAGFRAGDYFSGPNYLQRGDAEKERSRREAREAISFPDHYPPVRQILAGHDGSIWLLRELSLPDLVDRWEVYDSNGQLEGAVVIREGKASRVPWRPRLTLFRATREEIWGTTIDDLDVSYIRRYRVDKSCR